MIRRCTQREKTKQVWEEKKKVWVVVEGRNSEGGTSGNSMKCSFCIEVNIDKTR